MAAEREASPRRARRAVAVGALAVAAAVAPAYAMFSTPDAAAPQAGRCLAWFGSKIDGQCIAWASSGGAGQVNGGSPAVSVGGPGSGSPGFSTGPMLPGQTINIPIPVG